MKEEVLLEKKSSWDSWVEKLAEYLLRILRRRKKSFAAANFINKHPVETGVLDLCDLEGLKEF
jgi:hypothetical protein